MPFSEILSSVTPEGIGVGIATAAASLYSYAKLRGLRTSLSAMATIKMYAGNVTLLEVAQVLKQAATYAKDGYTTEEVVALGKKIIDAAAEK